MHVPERLDLTHLPRYDVQELRGRQQWIVLIAPWFQGDEGEVDFDAEANES
jgi:hypothetical protein